MGKDWSGYAAAGVPRAALLAHPLTPFAGWVEIALGLAIVA